MVELHSGLKDRGGRRSIRSIARSLDRVDRFDRFDNFAVFCFFMPRRGARDLSCVKVSSLYDAWRPKKFRKTETKKFGFFVNFDSIDSIIRSIRSIMCRWEMAERPDDDATFGSAIPPTPAGAKNFLKPIFLKLSGLEKLFQTQISLLR